LNLGFSRYMFTVPKSNFSNTQDTSTKLCRSVGNYDSNLLNFLYRVISCFRWVINEIVKKYCKYS
jgi:hypothetical protein